MSILNLPHSKSNRILRIVRQAPKVDVFIEPHEASIRARSGAGQAVVTTPATGTLRPRGNPARGVTAPPLVLAIGPQPIVLLAFEERPTFPVS